MARRVGVMQPRMNDLLRSLTVEWHIRRPAA